MRLADLKPRLHKNEVYLEFDCPLGHPHRILVPIDAARHPKSWARSGEFPDSLTLSPSILAHTAAPIEQDLLGEAYERASACGWHGFITNGEVLSC